MFVINTVITYFNPCLTKIEYKYINTISTLTTYDSSTYREEIIKTGKYVCKRVAYNVKIEYLVPEEFTDGLCLSSLTYSPGQCEYVINSWNMAKVIDVIHDGDGVIVKACLVPKKVYDDFYSYNTGCVK